MPNSPSNAFKLIKLLFFAFLVILILAGASGYYALFLSSFNSVNKTPKQVVVDRGLSYRGILQKLVNEGIIKHPEPMLLLAYIYPNKANIKPGRYNIPPNLSPNACLDYLYTHKQDELTIRVPEGVRNEVVAKWIASEMDFSDEDFLKVCSDSSIIQKFNIHAENVQGYLLPDTYKIPWGLTARETLAFLLEKFQRFYGAKLQQKTKKSGMSTHEVLTLASIVEAESPLKKERPLIAGVYLNRLKKGMRLQADPTIQYALGGKPRRLLYKDLEIDSPYNTYKYKGLPPGPIGNPSKSAILAVLNPTEHNYFYFVATGNGGHYFSKTAAEHQRYVNKYRRIMRIKRREARMATQD